MINFSTFLLESRLDHLKQQNPEIDSSHDSLAVHRKASDIIDHFADKADPNPKKSNTQWIINRYKEGKIRQEDHPRIRTALEDFEKHKAKLTQNQRDINQHRSLSDLEKAVHPHLGTVSKKQEKVQIKHEGADLIHDGKDFMVHKLKTKEAACHYGKGTKWCTAADKDNAFDEYNKKGPLYVVTHKPTQEKHQFHFESNQFMDAKDDEIELHDFVSKNPELKEVKEFREKSPYFARNPKEFDESMQKILNKNPSSEDDDNFEQADIISHPDTQERHLKFAIKHGYQYARASAARHKNATESIISDALDDGHTYVREAAIKNPNATHKNISKALNDTHQTIRRLAVKHKNATPEHFEIALKDRLSLVRTAAEDALRKHLIRVHSNAKI